MVYYLIICFFLLCNLASAQQIIQGKVIDESSQDVLPGAIITISGTLDVAVSDMYGEFKLNTNQIFPVELSISFSGYKKLIVSIINDRHVTLQLKLEMNLEELTVIGKENEGRANQPPNRRESMNATEILRNPSANLFEGMAKKNGIDFIGGISMSVINTRGFNSASPTRMLQVIDGVDNQSPGLNFSLGNFLGAAELDLQRMEVIVGASGPFYGPNAFNGVISMETKDPFFHQGCDVMMRIGERNLYEGGFRFAKAIQNSKKEETFAYKINFSFLTAHDWEASNYHPITDSKVDESNPGRFDAVNTYGDEYSLFMDKTNDSGRYISYGGLDNYYRTGYHEQDLVINDTRNLKANVGLYWRLQPRKQYNSPQLLLTSAFASGSTIYQGDNRFSLKNILFFQHKIEWRRPDHFFLRAYVTHEDAGQSYDPYFTALRLQELNKSDEFWAQDYAQYWKSTIVPMMRELGYPPPCPSCKNYFDFEEAKAWLATHTKELSLWHSQAEADANTQHIGIPGSQDFLVPGTPAFITAFNDITSRLNNESGGTRFYDHSALFHLHGEYIFHTVHFGEIRTGGSFREYLPKSKGTIFSDGAGKQICNSEFGVYAGIRKNFAADKLTASATLRVDKNQNFKAVETYAASMVYEPVKNTSLTLSLSSALRNPTLSDQYLHLNVGPAILSGQVHGVDSLITPVSFLEAVQKQNLDKLVYFNINAIRPEFVTTIETIIRTKIVKKVDIELNYYQNIYKDFIGYLVGIRSDFTQDQIILPIHPQAYRYSANSTTTVKTNGFSVALNYQLDTHFLIDGNYSYNKLQKKDINDPIIPAYNTPENKFNLGFSASNVKIGQIGFLQHAGFDLHYKWVESYTFEGSPQFTGKIPAYGVVNAMVYTQVLQSKVTLKIGVSNALNYKHYETYGGASIGRLAYVQMNYSF